MAICVCKFALYHEGEDLMSVEAPFRFALVAHSRYLVDIFNQASQGEKFDLDVHFVDFESAAPVAKQCLEDGAEVVICHGGTGNSVVRALGHIHPIVAIDRTDMDVINTIRQAAKVDRDIILASHIGEEHDLPVIEQLLDVRIHSIVYPNSRMVFNEIDKLYDQGIHVLAGGGITKQYMDDLGGTGFVIVVAQQNVLRALAQAKALAIQKRREAARYQDLLAVFRQLEEGVVFLDAEANLVYINDKAINLLHLPKKIQKRDSETIFHKLCLFATLADKMPRNDILIEIQGEQIIGTTLPVSTHQGLSGAVALFRDISSLQKINRKIGEELYSKGFISRYGLDDLKGDSPSLSILKNKILRFAPTNATVLIYGETGTGKELAAHAIHANSARSNKPFVAINFAALSEHLLESELFGYEEGAFTGARKGGKAGLFELANQGTLFLDEVGEISHEIQLRLLRVLEAKEVMRVGGSRYLSVDVRVISASHRFLPDLVKIKKFRLDLYYRLSTLKIYVPPLRDRLVDTKFLVDKLLTQYNRPDTVICDTIKKAVHSYSWPGNIREFLAVMESYLVLLNGNTADPELFVAILQENLILEEDAAASTLFIPGSTLQENLLRAKKNIIAEAIRFHENDRRAAAKDLGINYSTLWRISRSADTPGRCV
jgi:propionate catabolism operon transcriptional regulator